MGTGGLIERVLDQRLSDSLAMILPLLLQLLGLLFAVLIDDFLDRKRRRVFLVLIGMAAALIAQNYMENALALGAPMLFLRTLLAILGYSIRPAIIVLFLIIVSPGRKMQAAWAVVFVNGAVYLTALFSPAVFRITEENHYLRGPLGDFCLYSSLALLLYLLFLTVRTYGRVRRREIIIPVANVLLIILTLHLDAHEGLNEQRVTFLTEAIVSSCLFFYIWLHLQFVRDHEKALKDGQRVEVMLSQIRPHFLYNALGAIEELCESDPRAAKAATVTFSRYLRGNMRSVSAPGAIPFERELSHTSLYLELEQLRFEDALKVKINTSVTDFLIPALTLEPLVENAVLHGVRGNADGRGMVTISTSAYPDRIEVIVTDDGPGFDAGALELWRTSGTLANVRERLMQVSGGSLRIESSPGKGTRAVITLPGKAGREEKPEDLWRGVRDADPCD